MNDVALKCRCGSVQGLACNVGPGTGTRVVCYCRHCQLFARYLDRADDTLDEFGGTEILQVPLSRVQISEGLEQIRSVKITAKGPCRWYANCCKTPVGNALSDSWAFIGIVHSFMDESIDRDASFGPVRGHVHVKWANGDLPQEIRKSGDSALMIASALWKVLSWRLQGLGKPSPFFDDTGRPISEPTILGAEDRQRLGYMATRAERGDE